MGRPESYLVRPLSIAEPSRYFEYSNAFEKVIFPTLLALFYFPPAMGSMMYADGYRFHRYRKFVLARSGGFSPPFLLGLFEFVRRDCPGYMIYLKKSSISYMWVVFDKMVNPPAPHIVSS